MIGKKSVSGRSAVHFFFTRNALERKKRGDDGFKSPYKEVNDKALLLFLLLDKEESMGESLSMESF